MLLCILITVGAGCHSPSAVERGEATGARLPTATEPAEVMAQRDATVELVQQADGSSTYRASPQEPAQRANASWVHLGAAAALAGVVALAVGHLRTGVLTLAGAALMGWLGNQFGALTVELPVWLLPGVLIVGAGTMLYGYMVRERQANGEE